MAKITLKDGMVVEGTAEELAELAKTLGEGAESSDRVIEGDPQVGDKIRITNAYLALGDYNNGDILTVVNVRNKNGDIDFDNNSPFVYREEFEIIGRNSESSTTDGRIDSLETRVNTLEESDEQAEKEPKFKAGDVVRGKNGVYYVLNRRDRSKDRYISGLAWEIYGTGSWVDEDQVEKVSDEITSSKPKVGDKVIVVNVAMGNGEYDVGDVLTVEEVLGSTGIRAEGTLIGLYSREYKVVEISPYETTTTPTIKVGDYVRVVGDTYYDDIDEGTIVKITKKADNDGDYKITLLDESDFDLAPASSLEKLTEKEAKFAEIGRKVDEYKVGDIVEVIEDNYGLGEVGGIFGVASILVGRYPENKLGKSAYVGPAGDTVKLITPVEHRFDK